MTNYKTPSEVKDDSNYLRGLELDQISVYLIWDGKTQGNKAVVEYYAFLPNGELLFHGDDYSPSPLYNVDDLESLVSLLAFLTLKPGDTDEEYFKNYTTDQLKWAESNECEDLQVIVNDFEDKDSEYYLEAYEKLNSALV